jgi:Protein of unknown function (DUF1194)/VPDSG-CTERM motif/PEP-CTERM motif
MKKLVIALMLIIGVTLSASAVNVELALCIDGSNSILPADFTLQKQGYVTALTALLPTDGSVAIGVWQFSTLVQQEFAMTVIDSVTKPLLLNAINGMVQMHLETAIGDAINIATAAINGNGITSTRQLIDVSTDGVNTRGALPATAAAAAIASGIEQVNGLFVGPFTDTSWVPVGSLIYTATDFTAFQESITLKLRRELETVPEAGSTIVLLGLALLGIATLRRRC